ncbi:MAG: TRAM domain-containing protein, partial [Beijerinckiaceae bacterium]
IDRVRTARPDIALSSDFIVGFPGESDADFEATMQLIRDVNFASAFSFKYSARPGTPAATMGGQIEEKVKTSRLHALQALLEEQRVAFNRSMVGRTCDVLFDKPGRYDGQMVGRSPWLQAIVVQSRANLVGKIARVRIDEMSSHSLFGQLVDAEAHAA